MNEEKHKCENCNEAEFETPQQLRGHQMKCRPKDREEEETRRERIPFGSPEQKMQIRKEPGYHYRWFNDNWKKEPGRVKRAIAAGYEVVQHEKSGMNVSTNDDGSEVKGVLMRIPQEWYEEDREKKARELDKIDEQIHGGKFDKNLTNTYGSVKVETKING
jgi:IMP dehydrogenase/GMP reductase